MIQGPPLLICFALCSGGQVSGGTVAEVAGRRIDALQLKVFRDSHPNLAGDQAMATLLRREIAWEHAQRAGLLKGPDWDAYRKEARNRALARAYFDSRPGHAVPGEEQARALYLGQGEERQVWHLLSPDRDRAEAVLSRLRKGEDAQALAKEFAGDAASRQNLGNLGWIRKEQVPGPFGDAVYAAAPGALVGPVKTEFGWHVAKVLGARKPSPEGWARDAAAFRATLAETYLNLKRDNALNELRAKYPLQKRSQVLALDRTTVVVAGDEKRVAGRVAEQDITLKELKRHLQETLRTMGSSHSLGPEMKGRLMEGLADQIRVGVAARAAGMERRPEYLAYLWDMDRETAIERFSAWYLGRVSVPDTELEAHRSRNTEKFRAPGALKVHLLAFDNLNAAQAAQREAVRGAGWGELYTRHADRSATGNWDAGWLEVAALRTLLAEADVQQLLNAGLNTPIGPIKGPDGPMLFKVLQRRPGPVLPLAQCRKAVREDLLATTGAAVVRGYLDGDGRKGIPWKVSAGQDRR